MRVLKADQSGSGEVHIVRTDCGGNLVLLHRAVRLVRDRVRVHAAQGRYAAGFIAKRVALIAKDGFVAPAAMCQDGDKIGHGAAGHEQCRFLAQALGGHRLQTVDCRILAEDIIAQGGLAHRLPHSGCRQCNRITSQIHSSHVVLSMGYGGLIPAADRVKAVFLSNFVDGPVEPGLPDVLGFGKER